MKAALRKIGVGALLLTLIPAGLDAQSSRRSRNRSRPRTEVVRPDNRPDNQPDNRNGQARPSQRPSGADAPARGAGSTRAAAARAGQARADAPLVQWVAPARKYPDRYIVVDLTENHVYVFDGEREIFSAVAGTGTGLDLEASPEHRWNFSTPRGQMEVKRMEKDPVWVASDWYFIEQGYKPNDIPPMTDPRRRIPGVMGTTAIYLGDGIAIHGTNKPELLSNPDPKKRNVSHGCIRLTNEAARELMEMVEVGTPVIIK